MKKWIATSLMIVIAVASSLAGNPHASAADLPIKDGIFRLQIQANRQDYNVGDPIFILVSVINETSEEFAFPAVPPCVGVTLQVTDQSGRVVPRATPLCAQRGYGGYAYTLQPGGSHVLYSLVDNERAQWAKLEAFGYALGAGTYEIRAIPLLNGFQRRNGSTTNWFHTAEIPKSNVIRIHINRR